MGTFGREVILSNIYFHLCLSVCVRICVCLYVSVCVNAMCLDIPALIATKLHTGTKNLPGNVLKQTLIS